MFHPDHGTKLATAGCGIGARSRIADGQRQVAAVVDEARRAIDGGALGEGIDAARREQPCLVGAVVIAQVEHLAVDAEGLALGRQVERVELLRQQQRAQLVKSLKGVDVFPDYPICDSALLPMMSKQVRRTCASFPAQARELVLKNGVEFSAGVNTSLTDPMVEDPYLFDVNNEKTVENGRIHRTEVRKDMKEV